MTEPRILPGCAVLPPMELPKPKQEPSKKAEQPKRKKETAGRFAVINAFADMTLAGLDRSEIAVWLLLWRDTKPDGLAKTSQANLAQRAGVTERTARRAIGSLQRAKLLTVTYRGGLRRGVSTYRVHQLEREPQ